MDDRLFCRDAGFEHASVQSKAVFSHAVTVMDKICGWGSKVAACMWIYTKGVDKWAKTHYRNEGVLEATFVFHYVMHELGLCWNCRRSRVGFRKHNYPARRSDGQRIGLRKLCLVCGAMVHAVVLGANTVESNIRKPRNKHRKALRSREHGDCVRDLETLWVWSIHTPRSCMLTTVAGLLYKTQIEAGT